MNEAARVAAAIDVGSNTIKLTVARISGGRVEPIFGSAEVVRLSEGLGQSGYIQPDRMNLAVNVLRGFVTYATAHGAQTITAVGTEAVRTARNGQEFLERVEAEAGLVVHIIDGLEEAMLTSEGVLAQIDVTGSVLIVDIGGGSSELIATHNGDVLASTSLPVGSGIMTDQYLASDPPTQEELVRVEQETIEQARNFLATHPPFTRLILVGGVGQYLVAVLHEPAPVDADALVTARDYVLTMPSAELAPLVQAPIARARVLPAGFAIAHAINHLAGASKIETVANGLRIGILRRLALSTQSEDAEQWHRRTASS